MEETRNIRDWLAENPKMMGALWLLLLIVTETGSVAATTAVGKTGP